MKKINKVLIIKTGYSETLDQNISFKSSLGDVLRTTVILHLLKENHITWLVDKHAFKLLYGNPYIDKILIYDNSRLYSACRCWFSLLYFGHDIGKLYILNGGLKKWKQENKALTNEKTNIVTSNYKAIKKENYVFNMSQINENIDSNNFAVVDARSLKRFNGETDEPRKGLRRGSIKNSLCLTYG